MQLQVFLAASVLLSPSIAGILSPASALLARSFSRTKDNASLKPSSFEADATKSLSALALGSRHQTASEPDTQLSRAYFPDRGIFSCCFGRGNRHSASEREREPDVVDILVLVRFKS